MRTKWDVRLPTLIKPVQIHELALPFAIVELSGVIVSKSWLT